MQAPAPERGRRHSAWVRSIVSCAGLLGASGIALGAAGTHAGGGDLARLAAVFLLVHASAVVGIAAYARQMRRPLPLLASATVLAVGVAFFSGDLARLAFAGDHLLRGMAPAGGMLLIFGWIGVAISPWLGDT